MITLVGRDENYDYIILNREQSNAAMRFSADRTPFIRWFLTTYPSWASAIKTASSPHQVLLVYSQMHRESIPIHPLSIKPALKSCLKLNNPSYILQLHSHIIKLGLRFNRYLAPCFLECYFAVSFAEHAQRLFDEMPVRTMAAWNAMLSGYKSLGDTEKVRSVLDQMPRMGLKSWSAMIVAHVKNGDNEIGVSLFRNMVMEEGLKPNIATVLPILSVFGDMGAGGLLAGKSVHGFLVRHRLKLRNEICEALVTMYGKCRRLDAAARVLALRQEKDFKPLCTHICQTVNKGYIKGALYVSKNLRKANVRPNELTFTEVVEACMHSGLVEEGRIYLKLIEGCGLKPSSQHNSSMVQQYSDAGLLEEAYNVIKLMKLESDVVVWSSLLSACKKHKQFGMAERVALEVMKTVKPDIKDGARLHFLVQLYCNAYVVIQNMKVEPDVEVWSSFMSACKEHKQFGLAERVAKEIMQTVKPGSTRARLLPLVQLYIDAGLLEEANKVLRTHGLET